MRTSTNVATVRRPNSAHVQSLPDPSEPTIAAVRRRIAALEAAVARLEARDCRSADAAVFLMTVAAAVQGRVFSSAELLAHARVDVELHNLLGGLSVRRLGKRLRRLSGRTHGGLMLMRVDRDAAGVLWAVQVVDHLHEATGATDDRSA